MNGQLWQECRRRGCDNEPCCVDCEYCEEHCGCTEKVQEATERQEINAIDSDRPATAGEWETYRATPGCASNHQAALDSIHATIQAGRQTREEYDQRRRSLEARLYEMDATGLYDVLQYAEFAQVVNVIREFLGLRPFDGHNALTSQVARYSTEFAP